MLKKKIPTGKDDFKKVISREFYFVDKSLFIEEILSTEPEVILLPRPRRFGKTLNMSMLKYFFDIRNREENRKLFHGLKIEDSKYINEQGKYPVIYISFKDIKTNTWEDCLYKIKLLMEEVYTEHSYLRETLTDNDKINFDLILSKSGGKGDLEESILKLSRYMEKYFNQKVIILLDEYDTPITEAYVKGYFDEGITFFRNLMSAAFKSNKYLMFGVITGIIQISKESIFSGLNNLETATILDDRFNHFGLTEGEVIDILRYYELSDKLEDVKKWYNGYLFGNEKVYNPWSIVNYVKNKKLKAYWVNTGSNDLIVDILRDGDSNLFLELERLFRGESVGKTISEKITFTSSKTVSSIWSLMFFAGYLTYESAEIDEFSEDLNYMLVIPNAEVRSFFREAFMKYGNSLEISEYAAMMNDLHSGEIDDFSRKFQKIFSSIISYHDGDKSEKSYHNFVLAMTLFLHDKYEISSNRESGSGRYDIAMTPRIKSNHGIIFEFKVAKSPDKLKEKSLEALKQIDEKKYSANMKNIGVEKIIKIGIAFSGKELEVSYSDN